jgi:hypothetical protein
MMTDPNPLAHLWWWIEIHTGTATPKNGSPAYYAFWSGFGSDIGEYSVAISLLGSFGLAVHHLNCKTEGCKRIGKAHRNHLCKRCYLKEIKS